MTNLPYNSLQIKDLGFIPYQDAYDLQATTCNAMSQDAKLCKDHPDIKSGGGILYLLEHQPPVITVTRKALRSNHIIATPEQLESLGIETHETDRGGDVTYHGPGQLVAYPIINLKNYHLGVRDYVNLLERAVIATIAHFGITGQIDPAATGVWVEIAPGKTAKICAMGVRVVRWVTMHGLALNVNPDLSHFKLIVPCGLVGRSVTSIADVLGLDNMPSMSVVKEILAAELVGLLEGRV